MRNILEQLSEAILGEIETSKNQAVGLWYLIPNQVTGISDRNFANSHPCILFNPSTLAHGYAIIWIRSTTLPGEFPELLPHKSHAHGIGHECPLTKDAFVSIKRYRKIPATYISRMLPRCTESDEDWLRTFDKCSIYLLGVSRVEISQ